MPARSEVIDRVIEHLFGDLPAVRFDLFRRAFSISFIAYMLFRFSSWREWLTSAGVHFDAGTASCFKPSPLPLLPVAAVPVFALATFGGAACVVAGRAVRPAAAVTAACAIYAQLVDEISAYSLNKFYVTMFLLFALAPAARTGEAGRVVQSAWPLRVVQLNLLIQYFTAGSCKIFHGDWLSVPDVLRTQLMGSYRTVPAATLLAILPPQVLAMFEVATLAFELLAPILFSVRRLVPYACLVGLTFHAFIALTMYNLFYFSFQMVTFYVVFLSPELLERVSNFGAKIAGLIRRRPVPS
ncbi:MAG: HTTM domain-containing protein [Polyangiaceae bacterium]